MKGPLSREPIACDSLGVSALSCGRPSSSAPLLPLSGSERMSKGSAPPFPVVNPKPTGTAVLWNFGIGDWGRLLFGTAAGGVWGFAAGKHLLLLPHTSNPRVRARR